VSVPAQLQPPPKTITVLNLKGGVGKTHTVWLLAGVCQERRRRLLAIDADTQANFTRSLLPETIDAPAIEALFDPATDTRLETLIRSTRFSHVDVIPASPRLARFDFSEQAAWETSDGHLAFAEASSQLGNGYEFVIFDCPPRLSLVSMAALCASDYVIIPLEAADWGAQGIVQVTEAVRYVQQAYNRNLRLLGYLVSRFKRARSFQRSYLAKLREHFGPLAFDTVIPDLAPFEKSVSLGVPITLHAPASVEAGIARRLFAEVQRRISRCRPSRAASGRGDVSAAA
jgi:chromosome partitioning protein